MPPGASAIPHYYSCRENKSPDRGPNARVSSRKSSRRATRCRARGWPERIWMQFERRDGVHRIFIARPGLPAIILLVLIFGLFVAVVFVVLAGIVMSVDPDSDRRNFAGAGVRHRPVSVAAAAGVVGRRRGSCMPAGVLSCCLSGMRLHRDIRSGCRGPMRSKRTDLRPHGGKPMRTAAIVSAAVGIGAGLRRDPVSGQTANSPRQRRSAALAKLQPPVARPAARPRRRRNQRSAAALAFSQEPVFDVGHLRAPQGSLARATPTCRCAAAGRHCPATPSWRPARPDPPSRCCAAAGDHRGYCRRTSETGDAYDAVVTEGVKRFQMRHGLEPTGTRRPADLASAQRSGEAAHATARSLARTPRRHGFSVRSALRGRQYSGRIRRSGFRRQGRAALSRDCRQGRQAITDADGEHHVGHSQSDLDGAAVDHQERNHRPRCARIRATSAACTCRCWTASDRPIDPGSIDWSSDRSPNFTIRQDSGAWNALGNVKIDMPNPYSVYMHDTDSRKLFTADYRFLSHGCARVDNVRDLAAWLLSDVPKWSRAEIDAGHRDRTES